MAYTDLRKGRFSESGRAYFVTTVVAGRQPLFTDWYLARCLVAEMRQLQQQHQVLWNAWVIMPDHFHALLVLQEGSLKQVMQRFKGASARRINRCRSTSGTVWQPGFHDHALRKEEDQLKTARYIVANPLRSGLVKQLRDYPHWDSVWL